MTELRFVQLLPFHLAMEVAPRPPAVENRPPAYTVVPDTANAYTELRSEPPIPEPSADQLVPFHLAMELTVLPPAVVKSPPAYTLVPDTASARTCPFIPEPSVVQLASLKVAAARPKVGPIPSAATQNSLA